MHSAEADVDVTDWQSHILHTVTRGYHWSRIVPRKKLDPEAVLNCRCNIQDQDAGLVATSMTISGRECKGRR